MIRGTVTIDQGRCKGCNLCVVFCPQGVLALDTGTLNAKGYHPSVLAEADDGNHCTGCAICAVVCPDACFTVFRELPQNHASRTPPRLNPQSETMQKEA